MTILIHAHHIDYRVCTLYLLCIPSVSGWFIGAAANLLYCLITEDL